MARTTVEFIALEETYDTASATSVTIHGAKKVNNFDQCTNGLVQASSNGEKSMQSCLHGISGKFVSTHRRGY